MLYVSEIFLLTNEFQINNFLVKNCYSTHKLEVLLKVLFSLINAP